MNDFWKEIKEAFSSFKMFPDTQYYKKRSPEEYMRDAWEQTGDNLREAMGIEPIFRKKE